MTFWPSGRRSPVAERNGDEAGDGARRIVKDMGITHAEFFRCVQPLLEGSDYTLRDDGVTIRLDAGSVDITLGPEGRRSLGNFHLPRTPVELRFRDCTPRDIESFILDFDTRFRRGGG
jgi:hypothetical protein